jgi:hypothetical protein
LTIDQNGAILTNMSMAPFLLHESIL